MPRRRADLRYAVAVDREIFEASRVDPSLLDPIIRVEGGMPGAVRPFVVVRDYQGPQGSYTEWFVLTDDDGQERARSRPHRLQLNGQMFEDRFTTTLQGVQLDDPGEHTLTFFVNDVEVGSVPVFVESGLGGDPWLAAKETFASALKKGSILWITVPQPEGGEHSQPVWFVYQNDKVYVVNGPGEQQVPNLHRAELVWITARSKDDRSQVARVPAAVRVVAPSEPTFEKAARAGLGRRLNLPDGDAALERWKQTCVMVELSPRFTPGARPRPGWRPEVAPTGDGEAAAAAQPAPAAEGAPPEAAAPAEPEPEEEPQIQAQVDQEVYDRLIAEGQSERVAMAKAKAAHMRKERARLKAEQGS